MDSQEAERLLNNNNSIVGFKKKNLSEADTNKTNEHYININSKNFGFNKEMLMFDGKFLIYKNNLNMKIFTNTILKSYNKFKNFIDPSDVLPFFYNILKFPIKLINNFENLIVCIETNDNNLHPIGDSVISDDSMIYINIDANKGVSEEQLGKLTLVNYKKYIKYNVKQNVFRDYEIDNKKVKITI